MIRLRSASSTLAIASFIVVASTGLCMFFGYRGGMVNPVHEVFSLIFVLGCALHIIVNWKSLIAYLKRPISALLVSVFVIIAVIAIVPHGDNQKNGNPVRKSVSLMIDSNLSVIAALTKITEPALLEILNQHGFANIPSDYTIKQIAAASNRNPMEVLSLLLDGTESTK